MMIKISKISYFLIMFAISNLGASNSKELRVFMRCYEQLTNSRPLSSDPLFLAVKSGELKASKACSSLLDFSVSESIDVSYPNSTEGVLGMSQSHQYRDFKVLNTLHHLHRSWFKSLDANAANPLENDAAIWTAELIDLTQGALQLTFALFSDDYTFKSIFDVDTNHQFKLLKAKRTTLSSVAGSRRSVELDSSTPNLNATNSGYSVVANRGNNRFLVPNAYKCKNAMSFTQPVSHSASQGLSQTYFRVYEDTDANGYYDEKSWSLLTGSDYDCLLGNIDHGSQIWDVPSSQYVEAGLLYGFRDLSSETLIVPFINERRDLGADQNDNNRQYYEYIDQNWDVDRTWKWDSRGMHFFQDKNVDLYKVRFAGQSAGILDTQSYLFLNWGKREGDTMDGGNNLPRRVVESLFHDFMCRDLPVLSTADVPDVPASSLPFRGAKSCMGCHYTMDEAAKTMRGIRMASAGEGFSGSNHRIGVMQRIGSNRPNAVIRFVNGGSFKTHEFFFNKTETFNELAYINGFKAAGLDTDYNTVSIDELPSDAFEDETQTFIDHDRFYFLKKPKGQLNYRSAVLFDSNGRNGKLIQTPLSNLNDLAKEIGNSPDYHACIAKRYFEYFLKINVFWSDGYSGLRADQKVIKDEILRLGKILRETQDGKRVIKEILESPYYAADLKK